MQETADALTATPPTLDAALERYRRVHRRRLLPHYLMIADIASGRPINPIERRMYSAAAQDRVVRRGVRARSAAAAPVAVDMLRAGVLARIAQALERPRRRRTP